MGTIHNMENHIKNNFFKCDYTKSKKVAKEDIKLLAMLDKIITNASEFNECWFNINYDINILREALAEKLRSK